MPHAVTQSCVGDGSCVYACPVNCIQPTPDDPTFELAEMLFIDPATCVDCGACTAACPVDAIKPAWQLDEDEQTFLTINAEYYAHEQRRRPPLAPVPPRLRVRDHGVAPDVAIVGSGPAAMYAADELLTIPGATVTVYERLDRPYGLVRSGVAPDHRRTRRVTRQLDRVAASKRLTMRLGVEVGRDVTHEQLLSRHHAVIYAVGALSDKPLAVPGAELAGVASATEFVGWYNGHPDFVDRGFDLSHRRAVVVGNGNVALDVARILAVDPQTLTDTEITPVALAALRASKVEEVVVAARRGPAESSFTLPELIGLSATPGITLTCEPPVGHPSDDPKLALLYELSRRPAVSGGRTIRLRYFSAPREIAGTDAATGIELEQTELAIGDGGGASLRRTGRSERLETGLVLTAIGYRGLPVPALPFDELSGTVPNHLGRVVASEATPAPPRTYVAGWIKRGPTGFIGTNKRCAQETVATLVEDWNAGLLHQRRLTAAG